MEKTERTEKRVVIVDDSRTIQAILDNAFASERGYRVVGFASDAQSAVTMVEQLMPDIVTIDLCMPYIDGAALLGLIEHITGVCKIMVSDQATTNVVMMNRLRSAGASACLGKRELVENRAAFFAKVEAAFASARQAVRVRPGGHADISAITQPSDEGVRLPRYPIPPDEARRLRVLTDKGLADAIHERQFDLITRHMAGLADFPVCLMTFIDRTTQWIKSGHGFGVASTPRAPAFCNYTISQGDAFVVANTLKDARFKDNPLVLGSPYIRSYAGHPIIVSDGTRLGALCLIDVRPRTLPALVLGQLSAMADVLAEMIDVRPGIAA